MRYKAIKTMMNNNYQVSTIYESTMHYIMGRSARYSTGDIRWMLEEDDGMPHHAGTGSYANGLKKLVAKLKGACNKLMETRELNSTHRQSLSNALVELDSCRTATDCIPIIRALSDAAVSGR